MWLFHMRMTALVISLHIMWSGSVTAHICPPVHAELCDRIICHTAEHSVFPEFLSNLLKKRQLWFRLYWLHWNCIARKHLVYFQWCIQTGKQSKKSKNPFLLLILLIFNRFFLKCKIELVALNLLYLGALYAFGCWKYKANEKIMNYCPLLSSLLKHLLPISAPTRPEQVQQLMNKAGVKGTL